LNNVDFYSERNGECWLLNKISSLGFKIFFDVGANRGDYIKDIFKYIPDAEIHAFEILPVNYQVLNKSVSNNELYLNDFGLSDLEGELEIFYNKAVECDSMATSYPKLNIESERNYYNEKALCKVRRGDNYLKEKSITRIDMLKIDVEGNELKVMKGFGSRISDFRLIQFEFGVYNIVSHDLLSDFFDYLSSNDFIIGRLFPKGVYFFKYDFFRELFEGGNYIAIKKDDLELKSKILI
jgi:FkbM family methyltransferase